MLRRLICVLLLMMPLAILAQIQMDTTIIRLSKRTQDTMQIKVVSNNGDTLLLDVPKRSRDTIIKTVEKRDTTVLTKPKEERFGFGVGKDTLNWLVARPKDNWYISAGLGIQTFIGNEVSSSARFNPITPNLYVEVGKWIIPDVAVSLNISGLNAVSQTRYGRNPYIDFTDELENKDEDGNLPYKSFNFNYFAVTGQVVFDWMNFICGYEQGRQKTYHLQTLLGMGFAWETGKVKNPKKETKASNLEYLFAAGINNEFRVSKHFTLNQSLKMLFIRGSFDYSSYDENASKFDLLPSATIGITWNIIKSAKHEFEEVKTYTILPERVIRIQIDSVEAQLDGNIPAQILYAIDKSRITSTVIYYKINKSNLDNNTRRTLKEFAEVINNSNPNDKFLIIGSADNRTGTEEINMRLSEKRCKTVYDAFTEDYGVDPDKLQMVPLGGIDDYEPYELNRAAIIVIDDPEVIKILDQEKKSNKNK